MSSPFRRCLARLVFALEQSRSLDGRLLTPLGAARKQDDQLLAVLHQIEPVARSPIDPVFAKSAADPFDVRHVAEFEPQQPCRHFRRSLGIEGIEPVAERSEEHTSELQSLMRISYAVCCLKKKKKRIIRKTRNKHDIDVNITHNHIQQSKKSKSYKE